MLNFHVAYLAGTRHTQVRISWLLVLAAVTGFTLPAYSQQIFIKPVCGLKGSNTSITGSGWAEPAPVCHYNFLFDGTAFAPRQPDGLFGPPNRTGTIAVPPSA